MSKKPAHHRWFIKHVERILHHLLIYITSLFCLFIVLSSSEDFLFGSIDIHELMGDYSRLLFFEHFLSHVHSAKAARWAHEERDHTQGQRVAVGDPDRGVRVPVVPDVVPSGRVLACRPALRRSRACVHHRAEAGRAGIRRILQAVSGPPSGSSGRASSSSPSRLHDVQTNCNFDN